MTRETSQNADLDFEQMMGELAAMKTDLAHRVSTSITFACLPVRFPVSSTYGKRIEESCYWVKVDQHLKQDTGKMVANTSPPLDI